MFSTCENPKQRWYGIDMSKNGRVMLIQETVNISRMTFCDWRLASVMCKFSAGAPIVFRFHVFRTLFLCMHNTSDFGHIDSVRTLFRVFACAEHFAIEKSRCCHLNSSFCNYNRNREHHCVAIMQNLERIRSS